MSQKVCVFLWNNFINDARVRREVNALVESGYEVDVICTYDGDEETLFEDEEFCGSSVTRVWNFRAIRLWAINNKRYVRTISLLDKMKIGKLIDVSMIISNMIRYGGRNKYDFYHCNDLKTLPQGFICKQINKKAKLVYDSHEVETSRAGGKSKVKYLIERMLIGKADQVIMTTDTRAEYNANLYGIEKPIVIHNYPLYRDMDKGRNSLHELLELKEEEPILLYQGGFQVGRGIEKILQAAREFERGIVVFIGDGPLKKKMHELVKEYGIQDKVRFIPKVPAEELLYYTQHAYLGFQVLENTCFNHYSALSNKLLEYIMMEVPVVCSKLPEMEKVMNDTGAGVCIDTDDYKNIVQAVNLCLREENYNSIKEACKSNRDKYTWEKEKNKFIRIYKV